MLQWKFVFGILAIVFGVFVLWFRPTERLLKMLGSTEITGAGGARAQALRERISSSSDYMRLGAIGAIGSGAFMLFDVWRA